MPHLSGVEAIANGRLELTVLEIVREKKKKNDTRVELLSGAVELMPLLVGSTLLEQDLTLTFIRGGTAGPSGQSAATPMPGSGAAAAATAAAGHGSTAEPPMPSLHIILTASEPLMEAIDPEVCANILDVSALGTI